MIGVEAAAGNGPLSDGAGAALLLVGVPGGAGAGGGADGTAVLPVFAPGRTLGAVR